MWYRITLDKAQCQNMFVGVSEISSWSNYSSSPIILFYILDLFESWATSGMFSGWNHGAGRSLPGNHWSMVLPQIQCNFSGNPGNCQILMRSSVLAIALILICINISHTGLFFLREGSQKEKAYSESTIVPMNDNFDQVESVFWSASMIILFQDSKAGQMSLSPTLFCYNIEQKFRCDIFSFWSKCISFSQKC